MACVLTALIRMNQHLFLGITPPYSHQQCVQDNVLCHPVHETADNLRQEQNQTTTAEIQAGFIASDIRYTIPTLASRAHPIELTQLELCNGIRSGLARIRSIQRYGMRPEPLSRHVFISRQTLFTPHCCPLSRKSKWILR